jgi:hypothetical protein
MFQALLHIHYKWHTPYSSYFVPATKMSGNIRDLPQRSSRKSNMYIIIGKFNELPKMENPWEPEHIRRKLENAIPMMMKKVEQ